GTGRSGSARRRTVHSRAAPPAPSRYNGTRSGFSRTSPSTPAPVIPAYRRATSSRKGVRGSHRNSPIRTGLLCRGRRRAGEEDGRQEGSSEEDDRQEERGEENHREEGGRQDHRSEEHTSELQSRFE